MTSLLYLTPSSSSSPSGWELSLHIWAHVNQGYADPCSRFFYHVHRSTCVWRPRSPAAPIHLRRGPGTWRCIAAGRETTSVSYRPSYQRDTRQRNNTGLTCVSDGKPYQTLCVCDYVFRQAEKYMFLSYLMQFCSLFVVIKIKIRNASQFSHSLGCGAHVMS